jgi:hypothetical protein
MVYILSSINIRLLGSMMYINAYYSDRLGREEAFLTLGCCSKR